MKIKRNEDTIKLGERLDETSKPMLAIYSAGDPEQNPESYPLPISQCAMMYLNDQPRNICGRPMLFAVDRDTIVLWPMPDADYHALFDYNPARKRI